MYIPNPPYGTCPNCGHCPHCGRSNPPYVQPHFVPFVPQPYIYPTTTPWGGYPYTTTGGSVGQAIGTTSI